MKTTVNEITYRTVPSLVTEGGVSGCLGCAGDVPELDDDWLCQQLCYRAEGALCPNTVWIEDTEAGRVNYITMRLTCAK